ncbi:MAG: hypothetical protein ABIH41_05625 [Nanoarchaeota archaeon]
MLRMIITCLLIIFTGCAQRTAPSAPMSRVNPSQELARPWCTSPGDGFGAFIITYDWQHRCWVWTYAGDSFDGPYPPPEPSVRNSRFRDLV